MIDQQSILNKWERNFLSQVFISKRRPSPIHHKVDPSHKLAGQVRGQEEDCAGDVGGPPQPRNRRPGFAADMIIWCFNMLPQFRVEL